MSTYAIGDIQGCFDELLALLELCEFNEKKDTLWLTGDLINRGPHSLEVLRFLRSLSDKHVIVLGNHDLHWLAVAFGFSGLRVHDTLDALENAPDKIAIRDWLIQKPLLHYDQQSHYVMTHAGIPPCWSLNEASAHAQEISSILPNSPEVILRALYGDTPSLWDEHLQGIDRYRLIINYLTRMRFCYADGRLDLAYKGEITGKPPHLIPWFLVPRKQPIDCSIVFGHWAALSGHVNVPNIYALDTGCIWGHQLTAMRLEDKKLFHVNALVAHSRKV